MHSQHALSATIFKTALAEMLAAPPAAAPNAPARLRACAQPGATALFTTMSVDKDNSLTDLQATFLLCNTLGIHHPYITGEPTCHPRCPKHTPEGDPNPITFPIPPESHYLAYHAIACAAGGLLKARHDNLAEAIAAALAARRSIGTSCPPSTRHSEATEPNHSSAY